MRVTVEDDWRGTNVQVTSYYYFEWFYSHLTHAHITFDWDILSFNSLSCINI